MQNNENTKEREEKSMSKLEILIKEVRELDEVRDATFIAQLLIIIRKHKQVRKSEK